MSATNKSTKVITYYVYQIKNLINNKIYIGQSINIKERWHRHKKNAKRKINHPLYDSINKYGISNFLFEILAECNTQEDTDLLEKQFIIQYDTMNKEKGYNLREGGRNGSKHTPESIKKLSDAHKGKKGWNKGMTGEKSHMYQDKNHQYGKTGELSANHIITQKIADKIREEYSQYKTRKEKHGKAKIIFTKYNISDTLFYDIISNKVWTK